MARIPDAGRDDDIEVEWQFDALDLRPVERWLSALPQRPWGPTGLPAVTAQAKQPRRLADHYLDTDDWRIGRAGFVLRTRRRGRSEEATLKDSRPAGAGGLRQRLEVTETLEDGVDTLDPEGPVGRRVAAVAGSRPLRQVLDVRTRRRPFALVVDGEEVAELTLDETVITDDSDERPVRLRRVEVEVVPQWVEVLEPLVVDLQNACGLGPAMLSKFEAGLLALGLRVPGPPDLGSTEVRRDSSLGEVAYAVLRRQLGAMLARESGTRLGEDIEELHEMRVATRRLRAAIDFFADVLPARAKTLRNELTWLASVLGAVRDLDVQIDRTDGMTEWTAWSLVDGAVGASPVEDLRALLVEQRVAARKELLKALDSTRWERLVSGLTAMVTHSPNRRLPAVRLPAALALPDLVMERHRDVMRAARRAKRTRLASDFHRLRIRCKRLRYSLEFTAGVYGGRTTAFTRRLAKLQDLLGLMQDAEVASRRLRVLAVESADRQGQPLPPATVFAMGAVAERYRLESEELLATMGSRLKILNGAEWDSLAAHMRRRRFEATAPEPDRRSLRPPAALPAPVSPVETVGPAAAKGPLGGPGREVIEAGVEVPVAVPFEPPDHGLVTAIGAWSDPAWSLPAARPAGAPGAVAGERPTDPPEAPPGASDSEEVDTTDRALDAELEALLGRAGDVD